MLKGVRYETTTNLEDLNLIANYGRSFGRSRNSAHCFLNNYIRANFRKIYSYFRNVHIMQWNSFRKQVI